jgi:hypothetical protein
MIGNNRDYSSRLATSFGPIELRWDRIPLTTFTRTIAKNGTPALRSQWRSWYQ